MTAIVNKTVVLDNACKRSAKIAKQMYGGTETINTVFAGLMRAATAVYDEKEDRKERDRLVKCMNWGEELDAMRIEFCSKLPMRIDPDEEKKEVNALWDEMSDNSTVDSVMVLDCILKRFRTLEIDAMLKDTKDAASASGREEDDRKENDAEKDASEAVSPREKNLRMETLVSLENEVRARLIEKMDGQAAAVNTFCDRIWKNDFHNLPLKKKNGPRGVFTFIGAPFIGKCYMAKEAAREMRCLYLELDMKQYSSKGSVERILGTASGKAGPVSALLEKKKNSILAVRNIECASDEVKALFEQIITTGKIPSSFGHFEQTFENCVIIFLADITDSDLDFAVSYGNERNADTYNALRKYGFPASMLSEKVNLPAYFALSYIGFPAEILNGSTRIFFENPTLNTLEKICRVSFDEITGNLKKTFDMEIEVEDKVYSALLYAQQNEYDTKSMSESAEKFVTDEMKKLFSLFDPVSAYGAISRIRKLHFIVDLKNEPDNIRHLFRQTEKSRILFVGMVDGIPRRVRNELSEFDIFMADNAEEAIDIISKHGIDIVIMQMDSEIPVLKPEEKDTDDDFDYRRQRKVEEKTGIDEPTVMMFDYTPIGASSLYDRRNELHKLHSKFPELPIYITESDYFVLDQELKNALLQDGAKGIIQMEAGYKEIDGFVRKLTALGKNLYIQNQIRTLKKQSRVLRFETTPFFDKEQDIIYIRLKNFTLEQVVSSEDKDVDVEAGDHIDVRLTDVIGADTAKEELRTFLDYLKNPGRYIAGGMRAPRGVLLYGKPGTGKTMLAKALAGEANVAFLALEGSAVIGRYVGDEQRAIKELFAKARKYAPSIVFIDEIDTIGRVRGGSDNAMSRVQEQALTTLLSEMDGAKTDPRHPVFVMAATNYSTAPDGKGFGVLDPALLRRFDRTIYVELPDRRGRLEFLKRKTEDDSVFSVNRAVLRQIAERSAGCSLADLDNVIEFARRKALRRDADVTDEILNDAFEEILHGEKVEWGSDVMERIAYHEAGHAVLASVNGHTPSYVTITSRGDMGGYTHVGTGSFVETRGRLLDTIRECLGGRAAEILHYGESEGVSTGCSDDLRQATEIAKAIVCKYGMDDGIFVFSDEDLKNPYYAEMIHRKVVEILNAQMEKASSQISKNKKAVERMAEELLDRNQLTRDEIDDIMDEYGA
ncbi:MAG: AAA family ATPase [Lachnospiraceae bacterium]|nr:AAA family ATPase [Lachnospiraceae bacterium]MDY4970445.1 AAA family ATPase [Lachnospiraceae bacterium]